MAYLLESTRLGPCGEVAPAMPWGHGLTGACLPTEVVSFSYKEKRKSFVLSSSNTTSIHHIFLASVTLSLSYSIRSLEVMDCKT